VLRILDIGKVVFSFGLCLGKSVFIWIYFQTAWGKVSYIQKPFSVL